MTEGPYKLPKGWRWVRLGEIFYIQQGASMSPKRRIGNNPKPFLRTKNVLWGTVDLSSLDEMDFSDEEVEKLRLQPGDLLVCEGGDVGRTAVWEGQLPLVLYQNHIHRLRAKDGLIEPRFFMYWMKAAYQVFFVYQGAESRTAIPNLSGQRLKQFLAPLPPFDEQKRIVERLEALMDRVREARRLRQEAREEAERLWQSVLADTFPRPGSTLPPDWRWVRLGEVAQHKTGIWGPEATNPDKGFPIVRSTEIEGIHLRPQAASVRSVPLERALAYKLETGDILVNKSSGSSHLVGWPAIFEDPQDGRVYLFSNFMLRIRVDRNFVSPWYLLYYLHSPVTRTIYLRAQDTTSGLRNLRVRDFMAQPIPLPPLAEQRRIVAHLEEVQEKLRALRAAQAETDEALRQLEQSILDKAFRGEL